MDKQGGILTQSEHCKLRHHLDEAETRLASLPVSMFLKTYEAGGHWPEFCQYLDSIKAAKDPLQQSIRNFCEDVFMVTLARRILECDAAAGSSGE